MSTTLLSTIADAIARWGDGTALSDPPHTLSQPSLQTVAGAMDHTLLKPDATADQIRQLCAEARTHAFVTVCVNPTWVVLCQELLVGSPVKVCTVIGFPLGATLAQVKALEAQAAIAAGAQEVDMVLNIGQLKDGDYHRVFTDIQGVVEAARPTQTPVKVILETALLDRGQKIAACVIAQMAGASFVKTSTGFGGGGATVADIQLMRQVVGPEMGVKASGGVRTLADAQQMLAAGATRIGASAGVQIVGAALNAPTAAAPSPDKGKDA